MEYGGKKYTLEKSKFLNFVVNFNILPCVSLFSIVCIRKGNTSIVNCFERYCLAVCSASYTMVGIGG